MVYKDRAAHYDEAMVIDVTYNTQLGIPVAGKACNTIGYADDNAVVQALRKSYSTHARSKQNYSRYGMKIN